MAQDTPPESFPRKIGKQWAGVCPEETPVGVSQHSAGVFSCSRVPKLVGLLTSCSLEMQDGDELTQSTGLKWGLTDIYLIFTVSSGTSATFTKALSQVKGQVNWKDARRYPTLQTNALRIGTLSYHLTQRKVNVRHRAAAVIQRVAQLNCVADHRRASVTKHKVAPSSKYSG